MVEEREGDGGGEMPEWRAARLKAEAELKEVIRFTWEKERNATRQVQEAQRAGMPTEVERRERRRERQRRGHQRTPFAHRRATAVSDAHGAANLASGPASFAAHLAALRPLNEEGSPAQPHLEGQHPEAGLQQAATGGAGGGAGFVAGAAAVVGMSTDRSNRKHALVLFVMPGDATLSLAVAAAQTVRGAGHWAGDV